MTVTKIKTPLPAPRGRAEQGGWDPGDIQRCRARERRGLHKTSFTLSVNWGMKGNLLKGGRGREEEGGLRRGLKIR